MLMATIWKKLLNRQLAGNEHDDTCDQNTDICNEAKEYSSLAFYIQHISAKSLLAGWLSTWGCFSFKLVPFFRINQVVASLRGNEMPLFLFLSRLYQRLNLKPLAHLLIQLQNLAFKIKSLNLESAADLLIFKFAIWDQLRSLYWPSLPFFSRPAAYSYQNFW